VSKGLTREDVRKVAQIKLAELGECWTVKNGRAEIKLELTINADGTVKNVTAVSGTLKDAKVRQCLLDHAKKWLFPVPKNGQAVKATIILKI
jgi:hypothetical protein